MRLFLYIIFVLLSIPGKAQGDSSFFLMKTMKINAKSFTIDNLENLYLVTETDQLKKYNSYGDSIAVFNEMKRFGKLYALDVSNPLKILLFYKDFSTVTILDRLLSLRNSLDLRKHNILQATAVGASYDNNIWVFDTQENKLKKIDEQGNLLLETIDFRSFLATSFTPEKIIDQNNSVYLYDPLVGLLQFDHFGSFQKKHAVTGWKNIAILEKSIVGIDTGSLTIYNTSTLMQKQYQFPSSFGSFNQYIIANTKLLTLSNGSINIYSFRF
jgi:hypothetical protein